MSKIAIFLVVAVSLLKISACSPLIPQNGLGQSRASIIIEMSAKVLQLEANVTKNWIEESSSITDYKNMIQSRTSSAQDGVGEELKDLSKVVKNATDEAAKTGLDISSCVKAEETARNTQVRLSKISQCGKSFSFNVLQVQLTQLAAIKVQAGTIIPTCTVLNPFNNDKFKSCIQQGIDNDSNNVESIKQSIETKATEIYDNGSQCIQDNLEELDSAIETITNDFNECVKSKTVTTTTEPTTTEPPTTTTPVTTEPTTPSTTATTTSETTTGTTASP